MARNRPACARFKLYGEVAQTNLTPIRAAKRPHRLRVHMPAPQSLKTIDHYFHIGLRSETRKSHRDLAHRTYRQRHAHRLARETRGSLPRLLQIAEKVQT